MNNLIDLIENLLKQNGIDNFGIIPFSECQIINESLLQRKGASGALSAIIFYVPYYSGEYSERNISRYAIPKDYHIFFDSIFKKICSSLQEKLKNNFFLGFSDHSPINEVDAAVKAGLGVIGLNNLLITPEYGSYVFIGEILTDLVFDEYSANTSPSCIKCGKCLNACPSKNICLSKITQTKGKRADSDEELIALCKTAWGCDICQEVCPMNKNIAETDIEFFRTDITPSLSEDLIEKMSEEEFSKRAYAWKGKATILNNLRLLNKNKNNKK